MARPIKELKAFRRIHVKAGYTQPFNFTIGENELTFLNEHLEPAVAGAGLVQVLANLVFEPDNSDQREE